MTVNKASTTVSIRPGVSVLSVLRHLNYKPWYALAEFVDNAVQSFLYHREALGGGGAVLNVDITLDPEPPGRLIIRDNAAGIEDALYPRAFRPAEIPPDRTGLSEFGMGMKSAACWFAPCWRVRTSALGEPVEKTVAFDISSIVRDSIEELVVDVRPVGPEEHYTEIVLEGLYRTLHGRTLRKIKEHLTGIYRMFSRDGSLKLTFNGDPLSFADPRVLMAPHHADPGGPSLTWRKDIDFDFGTGMRVRGFAALREVGNTSEAGFALFRRRRLIQGSADEGYRPEQIFGRANSYRYQRLFGELELEGFEVSHTKDGFAWDDSEETFLELLREHLNEGPLPLLEQAENYRALRARAEIQSAVDAAAERTAHALQQHVSPVLVHLEAAPVAFPAPEALATTPLVARRQINVELNDVQWEIHLEMTNDPAMDEWVVISDNSALPPANSNGVRRKVSLRLALSHPFMLRFAGADSDMLEPLIRLGAAVGLAEVAARDSGVPMSGTFRRNINELLRHALSHP